MLKRTPLHAHHVAAGGHLVDFGGWEMPLHYGSQIEEHLQVRRAAGMFDVSHMTIVDLHGPDARDFLRHLLANDVDKLKSIGSALYGLMLNEKAGVVDDLIVYRLAEGYRLVVNCATRDKDLAWLATHGRHFSVTCQERRDLAIIAVQGPAARHRLAELLALPALLDLPPFMAMQHGDRFIARTGYTGEEGVEILLPGDSAGALWEQLRSAGITPAGLGARDTLRIEAGLNLYGAEMDESVNPLIANLGWTIAWEPPTRDFIGRAALTRLRAQGVQQCQLGLLLEGRGVLRAGQRIFTATGEGIVTSGTFSPTLGHSIAIARLPLGSSGRVEAEIRGRRLPAQVVKLPFVRHGQPLHPSVTPASA